MKVKALKGGANATIAFCGAASAFMIADGQTVLYITWP